MILVLGSVNVDFVIRGPRLPRPGETVTGGRFFQAAGGKGANQAVAAARAATVPVVFLAAVGDDQLGIAARQRFAAEGIRCDYLRTIPGQATGVALIMVGAAGENAISVASGANACLTPADVDAVPEDVFRQAQVLLACLEVPSATVRRALQRAAASGATTILNPAPADSSWGDDAALRLVDILTPNETEAGLLTQIPARDADSALAAARKLQQQGCRSVLLTRGADGVLVLDTEREHVAAHVVQAVDTTAAGDAFNGALAAALATGQELRAAVRFANAAAALSVTREGAQPSLPRRAEILALLGKRAP